jgi:hypothetical protein
MTTALHAAANVRNAIKSSGPRTALGKARSAQNALRHGLRSELPVLPGERARDWEEHQASILRSLAPLGALEEALAQRVALCLWRQRRVISYEVGVTAAGLAEVEEEVHAQVVGDPSLPDQEVPDSVKLQQLLQKLEEKREHFRSGQQVVQLLEALPIAVDEATVNGEDVFELLLLMDSEFIQREKSFNWGDAEFLTRLGVPADDLRAPFRWRGWTVGMVRRAVAELARWYELDPQGLAAKVLAKWQQGQQEWKPVLDELEAQAETLRRRVQAKEARLRQQRLLPNEKALTTITRYESHLSRQTLQALHELQRLQAVRAGQAVPAPAALDVLIDGEGTGADLPALLTAEGARGRPAGGRNGFVCQK